MVVNFSIYKRQGKYPTCPMHSCISSLLVRNFACANDLTLRMATTWCHLCQLQQICQEWTSPCDLVAPYSSWVAKESDQHFQLSFSPHFWSSTLYHPQHIIVNQSINYSMESCRAVCLQNHYTSIQRTSSTKGTERQGKDVWVAMEREPLLRSCVWHSWKLLPVLYWTHQEGW